MKKSPRKLQLNRETLRSLQAPTLAQVHGATGFPTLVCPTFGPGNTCDLTCDLCITPACPTNNCS